MRIRVVRGEKTVTITVAKGATAEDVLAKLSLHPDAFIVMMGKRPVPLTKELAEGDEVKIIKVASGG
jgi:sulfur carrier protein ThiS